MKSVVGVQRELGINPEQVAKEIAEASVLLNLCASTNRHGLNPWAYLTDVLTPMSGKPTDLTPLLPDIWAKQTR